MYRIMIVDDESMSRDMIQNYIKAKLPDYEVSAVCCNGLEALETFRRAPADIILVDIRMPVMDGLALIERLNQITHDYVPIIVSSYGEFEYAKTAMHLGVMHYLLKPLDFKELNHALEAASHTLKFNRIAHSSLNWQDDEQESFLMELMTGKYTSRQTALTRFAELNFPFSYEHCGGIYIQISFTQPEDWLYGKDAFLTAIHNLVNLIYSPKYMVSLVRKQNCCNYLLILENEQELSYEELYSQARKILGVSLSVHPLFSFASMEHLRTRSFTAQQETLRHDVSAEEDTPALSENTAIRISIEKAIDYMKEHYAEDLSRDEVAEKVYMSVAHFSRCFKMITNATYKDYLTEIRMQKAIELLKTNLQIQDIAQLVGYPNPNRFNINFRHYTSYTPSEYRTNILKML